MQDKLSRKGRLLTVKGNVCEPQRINKNEFVIIPHCCNNCVPGVMGAGVALSLRKKWPAVYDSYKTMEDERPNGLKDRLGEICWAKIPEDNLVVINMIGQDGVCSTENLKPVKYWALMKCMDAIRIHIMDSLSRGAQDSYVIHTCKFGSDLAGGNWDFILELIKELWIDYGLDVVIYEFEPDEEQWGPIGDYTIDVYLRENEKDAKAL